MVNFFYRKIDLTISEIKSMSKLLQELLTKKTSLRHRISNSLVQSFIFISQRKFRLKV